MSWKPEMQWIDAPSNEYIEIIHPSPKHYELPLWALVLMAAVSVGLKLWLVISEERKQAKEKNDG